MTLLDLSHGFLPAKDPLKRLTPSFAVWEDCSASLPKLLVSQQLKNQLNNMPPFPVSLLQSDAEFERAMLILSFLGHAYVWGENNPASRIPAILAEPWSAVAKHLNRPPVLSYASYALHNWQRINPALPIELGNIALLQNFLGGIDEEWFVLVHVDIEEKAGRALRALIPAQEAAQTNDIETLLLHINQMKDTLLSLCVTLDRMPEHCDPYIYYHRVRPYIHGWKNHPALPQGILYENCFNNQPQFFRGETGAQSSIIPALDTVFGIRHQEDELSIYLKEMRDYMPESHRNFLNTLKKNSTLRDAVQKHYPQWPHLREAYNVCIDLMVRFRTTHLRYAALYIQKQSQEALGNPNAVGTGGTPFMNYLFKHEKETEKFKI